MLKIEKLLLMYKIFYSDYAKNPHKKIYIFIIFTWISLWFSIDTNLGDLQIFKNSAVDIINASRVFLVIFFITLSILLTLFLLVKKFGLQFYKNFGITWLLPLFLYFILQIIGLYENSYKEFNLDNLYLILLSIGALNIFILLHLLKLEKFFKNLLYLSILSIFLFFWVIIFSKINNFLFNVHTFDFYSFIHPNEIIFGREYPRITGVSRMLAIINITLIIYFDPKKNFLSLLLFILITLFSTFIWGMQSRGTIICFFISLIIIIFFLKKLIFYRALILFFALLVIPILLFESTRYTFLKKEETIHNYINNNTDNDDKYNNINNENINNENINNENINNENIQYKDNKKKIRLFEVKNTSGRTVLWETTIKKYEKNKFFGYGPQADRFLLADLKKVKNFGTSVSNSFIYAFLCGGYIAIVIFIFIYYKIYFFIFNFFYKKIFLKKIDNSIKISVVFLIYFSIRSLIENSFSLFSIDFLLFLISFSILENFFKNKKI